MTKIFAVDAETDGLYGGLWAFGAVLFEDGKEVSRLGGRLDTDLWVTDPWVLEHVVPVCLDLPKAGSRQTLLGDFWNFYRAYGEGAEVVADFGAPVEAGLFRACVDLDRAGRWRQGPYPLHELGTALRIAGHDPDVDRRAFIGSDAKALTSHDPVDDARMAAMIWQMLLDEAGL